MSTNLKGKSIHLVSLKNVCGLINAENEMSRCLLLSVELSIEKTVFELGEQVRPIMPLLTREPGKACARERRNLIRNYLFEFYNIAKKKLISSKIKSMSILQFTCIHKPAGTRRGANVVPAPMQSD